MNPITQTRIHMSEHSYPTPTRNHMSMHNREAGKRKDGRATKANEVRIGYRSPEGLTVMGTTASEDAKRRQEELDNIMFERAQRKARMMREFNERMAQVDSWAAKQ